MCPSTISIVNNPRTDRVADTNKSVYYTTPEAMIQAIMEEVETSAKPLLKGIAEGRITLPTHPDEGLPKPRPARLKGKISTEQALREIRGG